jgi:hypothetical protein
MAISRLTETTLQSGFPKFDTFWDGRSAVGSMEPISSIVLTSAQTTIEFNNIPQTYTHLQIRGMSRCTHGSFGISGNWIYMNNDRTFANYSGHRFLSDNGTSLNAYGEANNSMGGFYSPSSSTLANVFGTAIIDILDYSNTNKNKVYRSLTGAEINDNSNNQNIVGIYSQCWKNTAAITSIQIVAAQGSIDTNSYVSLYGIK